MSEISSQNGKVVVNRAMSLDGFIAGPGDAMDWIAGFVPPEEIREQAAATGAWVEIDGERSVATPVRFWQAGGGSRRAATSLGEHTAEVLGGEARRAGTG